MKRTLIFFAAFTAASVPLIVLAQQTTCTGAGFCQLTDTSQSPMFSRIYQSGDLAGFVNALFKTALSVGAILAVLRIGYAGYLYMTGEAFHQKTHAREVIGDTVIGLLLLLSIYLILYQINPELVSLKFLQDIRRVNVPTQSGQQTPAPQPVGYTQTNDILNAAGQANPNDSNWERFNAANLH